MSPGSSGGRPEGPASTCAATRESIVTDGWDITLVAELVELALSLAAHQARVTPVAVVEREAQPWDVRVAERARVLEAVGGGQ